MSLPWARDTVLTFAVEVAIVAALLVVGAVVMRRRGRRGFAVRLLISAGIAGAFGIAAIVAAYTIAPTLPTPAVPFTAQFRENPVAATADQIERGRQLFRQNCVICHGQAGRGDGPAALSLNPRPVDLRLHVPQHPDGFLEYWIAEGVAGTAMPAWKEQLSEEQRWQIVRYLRELAAGNP